MKRNVINVLGVFVAVVFCLAGCGGGEDSGDGGGADNATPAIISKAYKVWGGDTFITGTDGYDPGSNGYTLLGQDTATQTFNGSFRYYILTVDANALALVDSIKGSDGVYYGTGNTGNTQQWEKIDGAPDGQSASVGLHTNGEYLKGYVGISTPGLSSITVYIGN